MDRSVEELFINDYNIQVENKLVELIESKSGITFDSSKRKELKNDLMPLMEDLNIYSFIQYYDYLVSKHGAQEMIRLINMVTVNETYFFRLDDHFTLLKTVVIPEILAQNSGENHPPNLHQQPFRTIRIWCAGCSSGEEVYSIAIHLMELKREYALDFDFMIYGTDINSDMISVAEKGVYRGRTLNQVPKPILEEYFIRQGDEYTISRTLRQKTAFFYLNLKEDFCEEFDSPLDIVFYRNVFIYFSRETNIRIIENFYRILGNESYLFLGPSESLWNISDRFVLRMYKNSYMYHKTEHADRDKNKTSLPLIFNRDGQDFLMGDAAPVQFELDELPDDLNITEIGQLVNQPNKTSESRLNNGVRTSLTMNIDSLARARDLVDLAKYDEAEQLTELILKEDPGNKEALILRLLIYCNRSDQAALFAYVTHIESIFPVFPEMHFILGTYHESKKQFSKATSSYSKVVFIDRAYIQAREKLLRLNIQMGNHTLVSREAKNILLQLSEKTYKQFETALIPKVNLAQLDELCRNSIR